MSICASARSSPTCRRDPSATSASAKIREQVAKLKDRALAPRGGLYVIGTERHESRRIDNQLRGRSGRQGDPGHSHFFLSLQDDLMRIFGSERMDGMLQKLGLKEDEAIVHPWINRALEKAQQKVEARNFDIRKNLLKFDDVMNDQRRVIFEQRIDLMGQETVTETVTAMRHEVIDDLIAKHIPEKAYPEQWDVEGLKQPIQQIFDLDLPIEDWAKEEGIADEEVHERITRAADEIAAQRAVRFTPEIMRQVEKAVLLQTLDHLWREHLVMLDHLRQVIGFRGYAQRDPLNEYKTESFELFQAMLARLREVVTAQLMRVELIQRPPPLVPDEDVGTLQATHIDATTGENEVMAETAPLRRRSPRGTGALPPRRRPERSRDLGQGRPQRALPLRLRQEIQALPRPHRLSTACRRNEARVGRSAPTPAETGWLTRRGARPGRSGLACQIRVKIAESSLRSNS